MWGRQAKAQWTKIRDWGMMKLMIVGSISLRNMDIRKKYQIFKGLMKYLRQVFQVHRKNVTLQQDILQRRDQCFLQSLRDRKKRAEAVWSTQVLNLVFWISLNRLDIMTIWMINFFIMLGFTLTSMLTHLIKLQQMAQLWHQLDKWFKS